MPPALYEWKLPYSMLGQIAANALLFGVGDHLHCEHRGQRPM